MALHDTYDTDDSVIPAGLRRFVRRRAGELTGLALLAAIIVASLSLASWSAQDPSMNHATDALPRNWLGRPGAIIADQLFRLLGLASLPLLFIPLTWALRLVTHESVESPRRSFGFWILAVLTTAMALSSLPLPGLWPMPAGMGGQVGDVISGGLISALAIGVKGLIANLLVSLSGFALMFWSILRAIEMSRDEARTLFMALARILRLGFAGVPRLLNPAKLLPLFSGAIGLFKRQEKIKPATRRLSRPIVAGDDADTDADGQLVPTPGLVRSRKVHIADDVDADEDNQSETGDDVDGDEEPVVPLAIVPRKASAPAAISRGPKRARHGADFDLPDLGLLSEPKKLGKQTEISRETLEENARALEGVLEDFGVKGQIVAVRPGPVVTLYELEPAPGIKSSRVISLADDIARSMSAISARVAVVQGRNAIGIELPNAKRETVFLREMFAAETFINSSASLCFALGKNIGGEPIYADLARMPHLLIAGTTGSGKSVGINTMILSLLYRLPPDRCKLIMIDPKMLELSVYEGIPHLLAPVVTDPKKAVVALKWAVREMEERYKKMSKTGVRNVDGYNSRVAQLIAKGEKLTRTVQTGFDPLSGEPTFEQEEMDTTHMPYIVVIIDEMADLMMVAGKDIEGAVQRLAQMARAAGIHVVMATQRPSVDVITGTIKANFPTRISFQVTSKIDSRTILGEMGAEQLLGQGDMLYMAGGGRISRLHGPFVSDSEVEAIVTHLKAQGVPDYVEAVTEELDEEEYGDPGAMAEAGGSGDSLYDQAVAVVLRDKKVSTSYVQRRLQVGYNKAASLIERMEKEGVISGANATGKREILVPGDSAR